VVVTRSPALFAVAAVAETGGAHLVWLGLRDDRGGPGSCSAGWR
jgi:drug/metabolite transporter superfamily protein YnfA